MSFRMTRRFWSTAWTVFKRHQAQVGGCECRDCEHIKRDLARGQVADGMTVADAIRRYNRGRASQADIRKWWI